MRRFISALLVSTAFTMAVPLGAAAADPPGTTTAPRRVYDPYRRDYHEWSRAEERSYREYLAKRHRAYIAYQRQRAAERRAYWRWRHDREERREHDRR